MLRSRHVSLAFVFTIAASGFVISLLLLNWTNEFTSLKCKGDANCPQILDRECVASYCNKTIGRCQERTTPGFECSLDEQCVAATQDPLYACNATKGVCACYKQPQCVYDDECLQSNLTCFSTYCIDGECIQKTSDGAQCSLDGQCVSLYNNPLYACNTTFTACSCYKRPQCLADNECPITLKSCAAFYCLNQTCALQTNISAQCSNNAECVQQFGQYYQCELSTCNCIFAPPLQINFTCTSDANCGNSTNPCQTFKCTDGNCDQVLNPGASCALDGMCVVNASDPFEACNLTSCECYRRPLCTQNSDCQQFFNRSCVDAICLNGHCFEETESGKECSLDEQCASANGGNTRYKCNTTGDECSCYLAPQCLSSSDCYAMNPNVSACSNFTCQSGVCVLGLNENASCSSDEYCVHTFNDPFYACNTSATVCQCYRKPECITNSDCPYNYALPCSNFTCQNNRCALTLNVGANCSTDAQCVAQYGFGYACNITAGPDVCGCYKKPQCVTSDDCPVNVDQCAYVPCINGTCTQSRAPNATCINTADCVTLFSSSLYVCNQTSCMCTVSPFAPGYGIAFVQGNATSTGDPITKFIMGHAQSGIVEADWLFLGNWSGGVRTGNALAAGPQMWGVTFENDTFTVTQAGIWQVAIQVQGAKPTGASQLRNWMLAASKNSNTTTYNQSILPRPFSSVIGFTTNNQILTTVGVTSFVAVAGDTFRIFAMETLPTGGSLSDIDVYNFWILVQKFPV